MILRHWFESRALAALQVHFNQPLKKPLPFLEARLLRGAVNLTRKDGGTPLDAAARFYAAHAETAVGQGRDLSEIGFPLVLGRLATLRDQMRFYPEHHAALIRIKGREREATPSHPKA